LRGANPENCERRAHHIIAGHELSAIPLAEGQTMPKSIYLINPSSDFPTYFSAEVYAARGFQACTFIADLAIPTLAALAPKDFNVQLCDENISPVDFNTDADYIGITGKITQRGGMLRIAQEYKRRGKVVLMGGPYASLSPEALRSECDILVRGEIENIAEQIFSDLKSGCWKEEYIGDRPDLSTSPVPRWAAYPNHRAHMGTLQTSRGCPFECEFCDVIQYLGRKQRHKAPALVLAELDELYRHGYRSVFLADDNFTVYRSRARELLVALKAWNNSRTDGMVSFDTQVSIDCSKDSETLRMCAEAGITTVFIGIETPNALSLQEAKKRQNLGMNLNAQVQQFLDHGIAVTAGMIVGFDSDAHDIFERQYEFAMSLPVPIFSLGALVAPMATPLHQRMADENRLLNDGSEVAAMPWSTNIIPKQMTHAELLDGVKRLCKRLYDPDAFGERVIHFIDSFKSQESPGITERPNPGLMRRIQAESLNLVSSFARLGEKEEKTFARICKAMLRKPQAGQFVGGMLAQYMQIHYMYERGGIWNTNSVPATLSR
jgi:radical SAM superfamily enzyme YgiQ (UPF0313 family)